MEFEYTGSEMTLTSQPTPCSQGNPQLGAKRQYVSEDTNHESKDQKKRYKGNNQSNKKSNIKNGESTKISENSNKENPKNPSNPTQRNITQSDKDRQSKASKKDEDSGRENNNINDKLFIKDYPKLNVDRSNN